MANLMSQSGGRTGDSSENTSGFSFTMGTCSGLSTLRLLRMGSSRLDWSEVVGHSDSSFSTSNGPSVFG
jgi:hypothetical protein